ncbi:hypothetical protein O6P43_032083 [Quillaja saponaria]|uniref:Uncharacterized protein n=1 Tax=Quillaja saponaria TaxID=32244 RepID=A0AAD7P9C0_QUISA|nr:hypothetical protein O6P43_032083 [Quillaja saponaria]
MVLRGCGGFKARLKWCGLAVRSSWDVAPSSVGCQLRWKRGRRVEARLWQHIYNKRRQGPGRVKWLENLGHFSRVTPCIGKP